MILRTTTCALAGAAVLVAAGCGSNGSKTGAAATVGTTNGVAGAGTTMTATVATTTTAMVSTTGTIPTPSVQPACRRLNRAARQAVQSIGSTLTGFQGIASLGGLSSHAKSLRRQIDAQSSRIDAVQTPAGPLTADKQSLASALQTIGARLNQAQQAAKQGKVGTAAHDFTALAQLTQLRHAATSLARDCPSA